MADDVQGPGASPKDEPTQVEAAEDAETRATRRELKQSSISDQPSGDGKNKITNPERPETPSLGISEAQSSQMKEQVSSPKKKRAHDQLDENQESQENDTTSVASTDSAKDRTARDEPEKKRHRDEESTDVPQQSNISEARPQKEEQQLPSAGTDTTGGGAPSTSFASSAFGQLASESSGFAALGSSRGKGFSSARQNLSSFASPVSTLASSAKLEKSDTAPIATVPKLSFGSGPSLSPFAGLSSSTNGFGGIGFGSVSTLTGSKPSGSFPAHGTKPMQSDKAARPFGAPDSDTGEDDQDDEDGGDDESHLDDKVRGASPEKDTEDKRRPKLQKIEVDDGEAGEVTVVSVRAKMFSLDKQAGWKERGAGMLKINVPHACVEFDDSGAVIPGSFDASGLEVDEKSCGDGKGTKVARLILRQDQTHRVILNTAILPAMEFQEKASLKSVGILFTALEGAEAKPVSITMRMSAANSKLFLNEINAIQRELRSN